MGALQRFHLPGVVQVTDESSAIHPGSLLNEIERRTLLELALLGYVERPLGASDRGGDATGDRPEPRQLVERFEQLLGPTPQRRVTPTPEETRSARIKKSEV